MKSKIILCGLIISLFLLCPIHSTAQETGADNIGSYSATQSFEDVVGGNDYVYLAQQGVDDAALVIINVSNPSLPSFVGKGGRPQDHTIKCVDVNEDESLAVLGASTYIYIFNISDKASPTRTDTINVGGTVNDVKIVGDLVYCTAMGDGLPVVNISDIYDLKLAYNGHFNGYLGINCYDIAYDGNTDRIYASGGYYFLVFELNSSKLPEQNPKTLLLTGNTMSSVEQLSTTRVAAGDSHGITWIIDISDINNLASLGSVDVGSWSYEIIYNNSFNNKMLVADYTSGLEVVDFSLETSPSAIREMGHTTSGIVGYSVDMFSSYGLLAAGSHGLLIYNLSDCLKSISGDDGIPGFDLLLILTILGITTIVLTYHKKKKTK